MFFVNNSQIGKYVQTLFNEKNSKSYIINDIYFNFITNEKFSENNNEDINTEELFNILMKSMNSSKKYKSLYTVLENYKIDNSKDTRNFSKTIISILSPLKNNIDSKMDKLYLEINDVLINIKSKNKLFKSSKSFNYVNEEILIVISNFAKKEDSEKKKKVIYWKNLWEKLSLNYGIWENAINQPVKCYKRDMTLCSNSRIPMKLKPNRKFSNHFDAICSNDNNYKNENRIIEKNIFSLDDYFPKIKENILIKENIIFELQAFIYILEKKKPCKFIVYKNKIQLLKRSNKSIIIESSFITLITTRYFLHKLNGIEIFVRMSPSYIIEFVDVPNFPLGYF